MATYIHSLPDWPQFRWSQDKLASRLAAVRHQQGRLIGRMEGLGFQLRAEAVLQSLTEEVLKSSEIEGEMLDRDQVRSSIARRLGMDIGGLAPADRNVEGVVEMMLDATQNYTAPLTKERLFGWHAALFPTGRSGMTKIRVGAWRDDASGPMQVVSGPIGRERVHYEAPAAGSVDREMRAFLAWFNKPTRSIPVLKAAARPSVVRHHPPVRRRQRAHRPRHRRHGAGAIGREPAALLQHVGANPDRARRPITTSWKPRRRATSISRPGSSGSSAASIAPSMARKSSWRRC